MPPRLARSSVRTAAPKAARNKNKKRNLNAYAIASHSAPSKKNQVKQHRLGEFLDDRPPPKRRRDSEDDDVAALDEEDVRGGAKKRKTAVDDDVEEGSDSEGNEWTLGGLAEDDEDSDLDSEEAFGESDEENFEGFRFGGSSRGRARDSKTAQQGIEQGERDGVHLDEGGHEHSGGHDEEEDDFGDEGVDLATMLDDDDDDEQAEEGGDESEDDEDDASSESGSEGNKADGVDDEERNARMMDRLEALDGEQQAEAKQPAQQNPLSVEDLLADLDPEAKKQFAAATKTKKRSERPTTLAAPLPKRQQERLNREVASKKANEQLDRWRDTVIQNRRAEFLSFPLKDPGQAEPQGKDKFVESKPRNELEANIQRIMEESGMAAKDGHEGAEDGEDAIMKAEGMEEKKMDVDEVMRRRAELRKARELLFREEKKAKRIAKIKSKSYRRVHRKEKARQSEREREEREMLGLEPMDEDEREKQDRRRAEERMGSKHRDSKWAKQLRQTNRAAWDEGARDSVNEEARKREELRRRVEGQVEGGDDSDSSLDGDDGSDDGEAVTLRRIEGLQDETNGKEKKGLANMKFMRDADARRKAQNDEDVERLRKDFAIEDDDEAENGDEDEDQGLGRAIFGPQGRHGSGKEEKKEKRPEMEEGSGSEPDDGEQEAQDEDVQIVMEKKAQSGDKNQQKTKANGAKSGVRPAGSQKQMRQSSEEPDSGPSWFAKSTRKSNKAHSTDEVPPPRQNGLSAQAKANGSKDVQVNRRREAPPFLQELHKDNAASQNADAGDSNGWTLAKYAGNDDGNKDSDSDTEPPNPILTRAQQNAALQSRAFAGDDVAAQFAAEKHAAESSEDEKETSTHLPGWGSWTGEGLSKSIKKANAKQKHNPLFKHKTPGGVKRSERQDKTLPNVIVSEKDGMRSGKGGKYLAGTLPRGFGGKEEYERSLRRPVGEEWGTKEVVQRNVKPRVVTKRGSVIEAMEKPMV